MKVGTLIQNEKGRLAASQIFEARRNAWRLFSSTFAVALVFAAIVRAEPPILDLTASDGTIEDKSSHQRQLQFNGVEPMNGDKEVLLPSLEAVRIEYVDGDPLFGTGAFTFMVRCKFGRLEPYPAKPFFFAGRWDVAQDGRVIGLSFTSNGVGGVNFGVSQFGNLSEKSLTGVGLPELPGDKWIVIVGQYEPGQFLRVQLYDADGELLASEKSKYAPPVLHKAMTPFLVGCMPEAQMTVGRVLVWDQCLSGPDVQDEVDKLVK
ncbi:MAG: hypothetical protein BGO12_23050 [Verrucomicrobia bacterium 61-8]|nr:hypothetical protein [Verrucomicrobiota bacterium]OJU98577.1 MAG: hypothetical protein BGO12_23050 [Verrucomicrobia bacterium 61-8]